MSAADAVSRPRSSLKELSPEEAAAVHEELAAFGLLAEEEEDRGERGEGGFKWMAIDAALASSNLTHAEVRILTYLLRRADGDGSNCFPSRKTIAAHTGGRTVSAVLAHLRALERKGWVEPVPFQRANGSQAANLYVFRIPETETVPEGHVRVGARRWTKMREGVRPAPKGRFRAAWEAAARAEKKGGGRPGPAVRPPTGDRGVKVARTLRGQGGPDLGGQGGPDLGGQGGPDPRLRSAVVTPQRERVQSLQERAAGPLLRRTSTTPEERAGGEGRNPRPEGGRLTAASKGVARALAFLTRRAPARRAKGAASDARDVYGARPD